MRGAISCMHAQNASDAHIAAQILPLPHGSLAMLLRHLQTSQFGMGSRSPSLSTHTPNAALYHSAAMRAAQAAHATRAAVLLPETPFATSRQFFGPIHLLGRNRTPESALGSPAWQCRRKPSPRPARTKGAAEQPPLLLNRHWVARPSQPKFTAFARPELLALKGGRPPRLERPRVAVTYDLTSDGATIDFGVGGSLQSAGRTVLSWHSPLSVPECSPWVDEHAASFLEANSIH